MGMIVGVMIKFNIIGMVGGYVILEVNWLMYVFMDGVMLVNLDVKFFVIFINFWYDLFKVKEVVFVMIDKGVDIMYVECFGVFDVVKEKGFLVIGNVIDILVDYLGIILLFVLWYMEFIIDCVIF